MLIIDIVKEFWSDFVTKEYERLFGDKIKDKIVELEKNFRELNDKYSSEQIVMMNISKSLKDLRIKYDILQLNFINSQKLLSATNVKEPEKMGEIDVYKLRDILKPYCRDIRFSDKTYGLTSITQAKTFSKSFKINERRWQSEQHDCDEFSFALMGRWNGGLNQFAFGIAWSRTHAFNIMLDYKKQIWIIEPQTNSFMRIEDTQNNASFSPIEIIMI